MIIDHGDGFYTLYGHLYKVLKQRGETVDRGEEVGLVGDSGVHDVSGLYFEVRQGGVPRDPMAWIASR
jgi:septal ring factor EnvC (AmiA/AmiB activator)